MSQNGTQPVSQNASPSAKPWYAAVTNFFKPKAPASNQAAPPNNVNVATATSVPNTNAAGATQGGRRRNKYSRKGKKTRKAKKFNKSRKNRN